jgi:glucosamine-6-phosphate deaminase
MEDKLMKLIKVDTYEEMSKIAAETIIQHVQSSKHLVLGLATGGTPKGTYRHLIEDHKKNGTSYAHVTSINLDEYVGLDESNPNSYKYYMNDNLFNYINIDKKNTLVPNGMASNLNQECMRYEKAIADLGGIDLQILGIGQNGHIGFNEPGTSFQSNTHVVRLEESTRKANARFFDDDLNEVPTHAITMGIASIMKSKHILLLAYGEEKADAMYRLLHTGTIHQDFPASALKNHQNVTIIADQQALSSCLLINH